MLRENGDDASAIEVLVAKEDARFRNSNWLGCAWARSLKITVGYGHQPLRTVLWSLAVILLGWLMVTIGARAGVMRATWPDSPPPSEAAAYEKLHPLLYSLDVFLPFVNLHRSRFARCLRAGGQIRLRIVVHEGSPRCAQPARLNLRRTSKVMEPKELGNTGVTVPEIGTGVWRYSGGVEPLRRGIELGAFLIDTAEVYGTEDVVGEAVKSIRDKVFVATKVSGEHLAYDEVLRAADASLRRLDTGHIDLYQLHWPSSRVPIGETMRAMETLVDRKLIRFIGVSNFSLTELRAAQAASKNYPIVANQVLYNLERRHIEADLLPYCQANQVTIVAFTPLASGRLARHAEYPSNPRGMKALATIAATLKKTLGQVALNWCTSHPNVIAIPKSNSTARVVENCGASGWRLSPDQVKFLHDAFASDAEAD